jgi:hypothetical protein
MMNLKPPVRCIFRADGTYEALTGPQTMAQIEALIDCALCDSVMLADRIHVMVIDDLGHKRGLPVNEVATRLYRDARPGSPWEIRGDVVVVPDSDYAKPDGMPYSNRPL